MRSRAPATEVSDKKTKKSDQTRIFILSAAARLFREQGYNASTLRKIAHVAGMEAGSIYYHFESKDEILDEVLELGLRHIFNAVQAARAQARDRNTGFRKTFTILVHTHLTYLLDASDFTSSNIRNFSMLPAAMRERHRPLRRAYADMWDSFFAEALAAGDIRSDIKIVPLRQFVLGALNWTVEWYDTKRHPVSMLSERSAKLILDGMSVAPGAGIPSVSNGIEQAAGTEYPDDPEASKAARTRSQILSAAAHIMRERGYRAATLRDIAAEAGMEAGSIYYHFGSKDAILDEVLDRGLRDMLDGVSIVLADKTHYPGYRSRLAAAIRAHMMYLFALSEFTSANIRIYGQLPKAARARHRQVRHDYAKAWDRCLAEAQRAGEIRPDIKVVPLRQVMLGALNWTVEWFDPGKGGRDNYYALPEMVHMLQTLLLDGIVPYKEASKS